MGKSANTNQRISLSPCKTKKVTIPVYYSCLENQTRNPFPDSLKNQSSVNFSSDFAREINIIFIILYQHFWTNFYSDFVEYLFFNHVYFYLHFYNLNSVSTFSRVDAWVRTSTPKLLYSWVFSVKQPLGRYLRGWRLKYRCWR